MKKREMFVFCVFGSSSRFIRDKRRNESLSRIPPRSGSWVHPSLPPYTSAHKKQYGFVLLLNLRTHLIYTHVGIEFLELPLACCLCSKFIPITR